MSDAINFCGDKEETLPSSSLALTPVPVPENLPSCSTTSNTTSLLMSQSGVVHQVQESVYSTSASGSVIQVQPTLILEKNGLKLQVFI